MGQEIQQYIDYRKDAWQVVYGNLKGFDGAGFWMDAQRTMGRDPEAMVVGYLDRTPVGMIQLSPDRDAYKKVGYIPFLYLREPFRHKGLGIQLIGHSISFYRKLGREKLQLSVAPTNEKALGFYDKFGFRAVGKNRGRFGKLILMEKDISAPKLPKKLKVIGR
jgi:probable phosphoglycerate mutase